MSRLVLQGTIRGRGETYPLRPGLNRVGSARGSQVELPFSGVSRHHARLSVGPAGAEVEDLASRNGTYVNGRPVSCERVAPGDQLRFGPVELVLRQAADDEADLALAWSSPAATASEARETTVLDEPALASHRLVDLPRFPDGYVACPSPAMEELYRQLTAIAASRLPVLVTGETGSGKEGIARLVHAWSDRAVGPFETLNCAALPAHLVEAQLFGVGRGVATGVEARTGKFLSADRGTIFLDEIGEMPLELQAKLLRVLEEGTVEPLGERPRRIDVRVVSATNDTLPERVARGRFRADLYFRIAGAVVEVPPLRRRREDIPVLVRAFADRARRTPGCEILGITRGALDRLVAAPWPGNVRQLEHEVERLVLTHSRGQTIDAAKLAPGAGGGEVAGDRPLSLKRRIEELEADLIAEALRRSGGNRTRAARELGLSRNGLALKLRRLDIERDRA